MNLKDLKTIANAMVAPGKGILAADESGPTIAKRFNSINTESTEENRRRYREMLFTSKGAEKFISGVILFDETLRQSTREGVPFPKHLSKLGIIPGIKVDKGAHQLAGFPGEKVTEGLDGLRERLAEYHSLGAKFAKWRGVIEIKDTEIPTHFAIKANAHALARYAALCQEANIVPIVEPEVLMDGAHGIERCETVTGHVLESVFAALDSHRVALEGICLKPNMVISGMKCAQQASVRQVAEATVRCLTRYVPAAVPGIVFLSGGQSSEHATAHLNAMNAIGKHPWKLSFSYGRALQATALEAWQGKEENFAAGQKVFLQRARFNSLATTGAYNSNMEQDAA